MAHWETAPDLVAALAAAHSQAAQRSLVSLWFRVPLGDIHRAGEKG
jgi:hypothetical protein